VSEDVCRGVLLANLASVIVWTLSNNKQPFLDTKFGRVRGDICCKRVRAMEGNGKKRKGKARERQG